MPYVLKTYNVSHGPGDWLSRLRLCLSRSQTAARAASALASVLLARPHAQSRLAQKLAPFRPMVERSVEQSVPPAGSGPRDFTMARLSMALMHALAAAGVVEEKRLASLEGFIETSAMSRLNLPTTPTARGRNNVRF